MSTLSNSLKSYRSPFESLRANGKELEKLWDFPFMLSLSKHADYFVSNRLVASAPGCFQKPS
jgi:hypothetical protein